MKTTEIRNKFIEYFKAHEHEHVSSSSLVPGNDPTLLFTNAGMVPFKDVFLGRETRSYVRAVSSQRCVRAGGKHNDLENVGYTSRHHTFFEMLGNFSFGDYFKREAITFAWAFLTEELKIQPEKLWVTVFEEDDEAAKIWTEVVGISPERCLRIGAKDNFWSMGDTGPCGPCSEIFYDHGAEVSGGLPGTPEEDGDRYVEIWNLVFMQYDRKPNGELTPLPKPSVDTGMGLERLATVMQNVKSNYDTDLFKSLITTIAKVVNIDDLNHVSLRVIADHIRSCSFLIVDGVLPSNEGRGYVLRRIIRRAARHGYELGVKEPFFYRIVETLCQEMGEAYPELVSAKAAVEKALKQEETRFAETLEHGMKILEDEIQELKGTVIPGVVVFKLYDTYGFPVDLTEDIAQNKGLTLDLKGFDAEMNAQRERARAASNFSTEYQDTVTIEAATEFTGYVALADVATVMQIVANGRVVEKLESGHEGVLVLDKTPFYAESGGQAGDSGTLINQQVKILVTDTQKQGPNVYLHSIRVTEGVLNVGDELKCQVNVVARQDIECNHSATHLLHAALRQVLGEHVQQKGSLVDDERLRFDFSHPQPVTRSELVIVEQIVNEQIRKNSLVSASIMAIDEAKKSGAMALFGEKYGDEVRVLRMGDFSVELCGGTHVERTGEIGLLKIASESGVASGIRRVEAVTAARALLAMQENDACVQRIADVLKAKVSNVPEKVTQLLDKQRKLEKELAQVKSKMASAAGSDLSANAQKVDDINVLAAVLDGADVKTLRDTVDQLKNKLGTSAIVLASVDGDKVRLVAGVSKDAMGRVKAGALVSMVAQQVGGKGGGRPDMAQAGGTEPEKLASALASVNDWITGQLA